jgi:UDP-N-acetylglucosamine--N-acetylmuramyl-(pentapeptide) pyrophosphoryl-undecaprenol N-acetylglucosamine transferase
VTALLPTLIAETDWHVLHVTGPQQLERARTRAGALADHPRYRAVGYMDRMPEAILASDLVISRAGATTLAELTAVGRPMLLVPYPHAGAHQRLNAVAIVEAGAGIEMPDATFTDVALGDTLLPLLGDPERLGAMAEASKRLGKPHAADELAAVMIGFVGAPASAGGLPGAK